MTEKAGLKGQGWGGDVAVFDYDGDGRLDLFVTNMFGRSQLYRNNGDGTFTDVTAGGARPHLLGRHRRQGVRLQQRRPARPVHRRHALRHVDAAWTPTPLAGAGRRRQKKYRYVIGPLRDSRARRSSRRRSELGADVRLPTTRRCCSATPCSATLGEGKFDGGLRPGRTWRRSGRGASPPATSTTTASRTSSCPPAWATRSTTGPTALLMNHGDGTFTRPGRRAGHRAAAARQLSAGADRRQAGGAQLALRRRRPTSTATAGWRSSINNFNDQPYYFQNQFPQEELRRLPAARHEEQPRRDRRRGPAAIGRARC